MIKQTVCIAFIGFGLVGCSQNLGFELFKKDHLFEQALLNTKKADLINSFETKAIINATYLDPIDEILQKNSTEDFIIGVYITEDEKAENKRYLNNPNYKLTLNDTNATQIKELNSTNKFYDHIPLKNPWAKYYTVSFAKNDKAKKLNLKYTHKTLGNASVIFDAN